jgi:hypothetical protein
MKTKRSVVMNEIPKCKVCGKNAQNAGKRKDGSIIWRKFTEKRANQLGIEVGYACSGCHNLNLALKNGYSSLQEWQNEQALKGAKNAGFETVSEWRNSTHPYRKHRKTYCENDECNANIIGPHQLDVHHINGDPSDNCPSNLITLCKNCHADLHFNQKELAQTPGRKELGITY